MRGAPIDGGADHESGASGAPLAVGRPLFTTASGAVDGPPARHPDAGGADAAARTHDAPTRRRRATMAKSARHAASEKKAIEIATPRRTEAQRRIPWHAGGGPRPEPTDAQKRAMNLPTERPKESQ